MTKEQAARLARITILLPKKIGSNFSPEEVMELLASQREIIANRIEKTSDNA